MLGQAMQLRIGGTNCKDDHLWRQHKMGVGKGEWKRHAKKGVMQVLATGMGNEQIKVATHVGRQHSWTFSNFPQNCQPCQMVLCDWTRERQADAPFGMARMSTPSVPASC